MAFSAGDKMTYVRILNRFLIMAYVDIIRKAENSTILFASL
jgi:hypothetical protein